MLTVLACIALVLGTAWLLVLYPSFRKACAIVLGVATAIPVLVYGIAEIIAFEQRHQQAVQRGPIAIRRGKQIRRSRRPQLVFLAAFLITKFLNARSIRQSIIDRKRCPLARLILPDDFFMLL